MCALICKILNIHVQIDLCVYLYMYNILCVSFSISQKSGSNIPKIIAYMFKYVVHRSVEYRNAVEAILINCLFLQKIRELNRKLRFRIA